MHNDIGLFDHFRLLFSFRGRENLGSFWPYAALVFGIMTALNMLMMIPLMMMSIGNMLESGMPPQVSTFVIYFGVMTLLGFMLYAAAMVRRLRDTGRSPLWALLPLPFAIVSALGMTQMFGSPFDGIPPDITMLKVMLVSSALETLSVIVLIFLLTLRSATSSSGGKGSKAVPHYHEE